MMAKRLPTQNLSDEAKRLFKRIVAEYAGIDDDAAATLILLSAMEAFDRMRQAQAAIQAHGVTFLDRYEQPRINPAVAAERDARAAMLSAIKQLNLDIETIEKPFGRPGRPPGR